MRVVCGNCDREPARDARAGTSCAGCGTPLVRVADDADFIGQVIDGRFEILAKLAEGGMGTVFRARQRSIGREVALKLIHPGFAGDVAAVKRFMREAKLASELSHPNTVAVLDFGQHEDGRLYLAMELVRGRTLYDVLREGGPLPLVRIGRIGVQLIDALETAHALSIVHRDLKLENVMLLDAPAGRDLVKILDFGLARSFTDHNARATATGVIAGTPRYLAPELLDGAEPAPAQDLYALGVLLGELAIGGSLWDAPTFDSVLAMKLQGPPATLDTVAPELRGLVARLLAIAPSARPAHAEVRAALLALERAQEPPALSIPYAPSRASSPLALEPTGVQNPPAAVAGSAAFVPRVPLLEANELELEPEWKQQKAARVAAAPLPAPRHPLRWTLLIIVIVGGLAGSWYAVMRSHSSQSSTHAPTRP